MFINRMFAVFTKKNLESCPAIVINIYFNTAFFPNMESDNSPDNIKLFTFGISNIFVKKISALFLSEHSKATCCNMISAFILFPLMNEFRPSVQALSIICTERDNESVSG